MCCRAVWLEQHQNQQHQQHHQQQGTTTGGRVGEGWEARCDVAAAGAPRGWPQGDRAGSLVVGGRAGGGHGGVVCVIVVAMEIDARFRYYFQHPWSRMLVAYLVTFCNFLIFAEDPLSHSQTQAHMAVVGNCFSFLFNKYPGGAWNAMKVICWILAIIAGLLAGKFIFHRRLFNNLASVLC
ncbi:hypothetical protein CRUP_015287 [Coryphaenoides rupestris]|nr:hypothetical protein CRUP_015287 [Coryphaenoides rupestris]